MKETTKASIRRQKEDAARIFPWKTIFVDKGIDIGSGDDPLDVPDVTTFDLPNDANHLSTYFPAGAFDFAHASQVLEHMFNPKLAVADWLKVIKPEGHLVITVPAMELYGDLLWGKGPNFNLDHKSSWSLWMRGSPAPMHIFVPEFTAWVEKQGLAKTILCRLVDTNYNYKIGFSVDQTLDFEAGVECWIEMVFQKSK